MFQINRFLFITMISSLIISACTTTGTNVPQTATEKTATTIPIVPTNTLRPTKLAARYPVPNHSFNIEEDGDALSFENGSPIPAMSTYYKNQLIADNCELDSESGSSMEAVVMVFENCVGVDSLRIIIYAHPRNSGSVVTIAPDH